MLLIVAPLNPLAENSSKAASNICPRLSNSSANNCPFVERLIKNDTLDRTFSQELRTGSMKNG
jgi:hypothetical protein